MQSVVLYLTAHQQDCLDSIAQSLKSIAKCLETQWACNATPKDELVERHDKEGK